MKVVRATRFGGPEVLVVGEAADPVAGPGEVVVEASVVDVLFVEAQIRSGWGGEYFTVEPPYVPGGGVAGRVVAIGEGVDPAWTGRRVLARVGDGGYAERVVAPVTGLAPVPDALDLREAAALLHDGATAMGLMDVVEVRPGETVLVTAAAGGLGILLAQLARAAGARVIGAARGERKLEVVRELGADAVDYSGPGWTGAVRELTGGGPGWTSCSTAPAVRSAPPRTSWCGPVGASRRTALPAVASRRSTGTRPSGVVCG
nr:hypothetical protein GCM10020241_11610 [Streptoalloteichus tenebrarius]